MSPPKGETEVPLQPLVIEDKLWVFHTGHRWSENICCVPIWYTTWSYNATAGTYSWDPAGWKEIPGHEIDEKATVAPVYDPVNQRISIYYAYDGHINWFYSPDFGAHWSANAAPVGGLKAVSGKFVHAIYWPTTTTTALVAATGEVMAFNEGRYMGSLSGAPAEFVTPFLVDLGGSGKIAVLYALTNNTPMMRTLDYATSSWSQPTQLVYLPDTGVPLTWYWFSWWPRGAINLVPNAGGYDRHLYVLYGVHFWESYSDEGVWWWFMHDEGILGPSAPTPTMDPTVFLSKGFLYRRLGHKPRQA